MLDRTEQRIVGVLIEKEATVPDIYPMSENALRDGCNQKSNRDPVMELEPFQIAGTLMALRDKGWIARIDGGGRVTKYRHKVIEQLGLTKPELAVLCELLVRGPQAPGALKPRVQRLGFTADAAGVEQMLQQMASRPQPLVEQLPHRPRERDRRWTHLLGERGEDKPPLGEPAVESTAVPAPAPSMPAPAPAALEARLAALEQQVAELDAAVRHLQQERDGGAGASAAHE